MGSGATGQKPHAEEEEGILDEGYHIQLASGTSNQDLIPSCCVVMTYSKLQLLDLLI